MDVSIIIVNYNTAQLTLNCIDSIKRYTKGVSYEIILVDNNSAEDISELMCYYPDVIFIKNTSNLGFGGANNVGYKQASGKYVFLLNSDTYLLNDAISIFFNVMEGLPSDVVCIGTWLLNEDRTVGYSYGYYLSISSIFNGMLKLLTKKRRAINNSDMLEVEVVLGADMFIRNTPDVIKGQIFDERYFMYNEENDFQYALAKENYKKLLIKGPMIVHLGGCSDDGKMNTNIIKSSFIYIRKWHNWGYYFLYRLIYVIMYIPRILTNNRLKGQKSEMIRTILTYKFL